MRQGRSGTPARPATLKPSIHREEAWRKALVQCLAHMFGDTARGAGAVIDVVLGRVLKIVATLPVTLMTPSSCLGDVMTRRQRIQRRVDLFRA